MIEELKILESLIEKRMNEIEEEIEFLNKDKKKNKIRINRLSLEFSKIVIKIGEIEFLKSQ